MSTAKQVGLESLPDPVMTEVSKDFFFDGMALPASVYLRMKPGNYLLIGKRGDKASFSNLHSFHNQNAKFFVKNSEHSDLIITMSQITSKMIQQKNIPENVKVKFLSSLAEESLDSISTSGVVSVAKVQRVAGLLDQMSKNFNAFNQIIELLKTLPQSESKHSMSTCLLSLLIGEEMDIRLPAAREKLAMGALLHDVGLKFIPESILKKPRHLWSQKELEIYEQHPLKGAEMLRDLKEIPSDVLLIIAEHHELAQGTGYPKKIRDVKISPLSKVVALADFFSELVLTKKEGVKEYTADEAIHFIEDVLGQPFNKQVFQALKNLINKRALAGRGE
jgi:putative nucleotidyltransferase with HDIG domain